MSASRCCVCVFAGMTARLDVSGRKERPSSASVVHPASGKDASRKGISFFICSIHRSEEHTSELQSLMRISYVVFCLKKKNFKHTISQLQLIISIIPAHIYQTNINNEQT